MREPDQLGDEFVSKKVLQALGVTVPEDALGFYVEGSTLFFEVMETDDAAGSLMIKVDTVAHPLSAEQLGRLRADGLDSAKGFRLG